MSNLALTNCVGFEFNDRLDYDIVYNYAFIEDYFDPPAKTEPPDEIGQTAGSSAGTELSQLPPASTAGEGKKPLISPDDYAPLDHPLSLMVYSYVDVVS